MLNFVYFSYMDILLISSSNISYKTAAKQTAVFFVYRWFRVAISVGMWYTLIEMNAKKCQKNGDVTRRCLLQRRGRRILMEGMRISMLSDNLKNRRKAQGLSQDELASRVHVVRQTISKWENGLSVPDSDMLPRLAEALDTSVSMLLAEPAAPEEETQIQAVAAKLAYLTEQWEKRSERRRKIWRGIFILLGLIAVLALFSVLTDSIPYQAVIKEYSDGISVIGGYNGATNIYIANSVLQTGVPVAALAAIAVSAVGFYKTRRK